MKLKELIKHLQKLETKNGNCEVVISVDSDKVDGLYRGVDCISKGVLDSDSNTGLYCSIKNAKEFGVKRDNLDKVVVLW